MHQSVLLNEFLEYSRIRSPTPVFWDGTMGAAGHLIAWLQNHPHGKAYGSDQDTGMISIAQKAIESQNMGDRVKISHSNFSQNPFQEYSPFDVILLDLGISSYHLDSFNRGISFRDTGILDMRMDTDHGEPLQEWLKRAREDEIRNIIYKYGEESHAPRIAAKIIETRDSQESLTPAWLNDICKSAYARDKKHFVTNPGVKTFQAFRIFINHELDHLEKSLEFLPEQLKVGGVLIIISFHSLEDRIVKHTFKNLEKIKNTDPHAKSEYSEGNYKMITKKPVLPSQEELSQNNRARSAKMRVLKRIR